MKKKILSMFALVGFVLVGCKGNPNPSTSISEGNNYKPKEDIKGIKYLYHVYEDSMQFDWEQYVYEGVETTYDYLDYGKSADDNVILNNPDVYPERNITNQSKHLKISDVKRASEDDSTSGPGTYVNEGLTKAEFFEYAALMPNASKEATGSVQTVKEYLGLENWAIQYGYTNFERTTESTRYNNDIVIGFNDQKEDVVVDYDSSLNITTAEKLTKFENQQFLQNIDGNNTYVAIVDEILPEGQEKVKDERGKYSIPENYRYMETLAKNVTFKDIFSGFPMTSSMSDSYNKQAFDAPKYEDSSENDRVFTGEKNSAGEVTLSIYERIYFASPYYQTLTLQLSAKFDAQKRMTYYDYTYSNVWRDEVLEDISLITTITYDDEGDYEGERFDYNNYYDQGMLLPTVEDGNLDNQAESLLDSLSVYRMSGEVNEPTEINQYSYESNQLSSSNTYQTVTEITEHLYNDNVITGTYRTEYYDSEVAEVVDYEIQQFNKDNKTYRTYDSYSEGRFKQTLDWESSQEPMFSLLDDNYLLNLLTSKDAYETDDSVETKLVANLVPQGEDEYGNIVEEHYEIVYQACIQQFIAEDGAYVGHLQTWTIAFTIIE